MTHLLKLNEDEIKYVCSVIPLQESVRYFKLNPKDFAKIMPGFRATSLKNQEQVGNMLFRYRNHSFISPFIEKHISRWLDEIQKEITLITDKGDSKESAWLQTLPFCFFIDDIGIFFKLIGEEHSDEYISLLDHSIRRIQDLNNSIKKLKVKLLDNESEQERLKNEIIRYQIDLEKSSKKTIEYAGEIKKYKNTNADLKKAESIILSREQEIVVLKNRIQDYVELIHNFRVEISAAKEEQRQFEVKIREQFENQRVEKLIEQAVSMNPKSPKDKENFKSYLGYNLESLGVATNTTYYSLLKEYLCMILFTGKPILINRKTSASIMRCIGNALVGSADIFTLVFKSDISEQKINLFLSSKNRILCLENFIGNFDETILTTICDKHKDKIIFLTITYERTLRYVPEEFLKYCHYINLNRIDIFSYDRIPTEDPSFVEEVETADLITITDSRWSKFLKEMLDEIGINNTLSVHKSLYISDEARLCQMLAFDILPFCEDVYEIHPYSVSERLNKYAGDNGRCFYKELFRRWFT